MGDYLAGEEMRVSRCLAWGSALRASYFLLLRQKKVSKEKATPGSASGCARSLALLDGPGGWQTRLRLRQRQPTAPGPPALLSASQGARKTIPAQAVFRIFAIFCAVDRNSLFLSPGGRQPDVFPGPHVARRATQMRPGVVGEDCLRAAGPSSAAPGPYRVAQGSRRSRPHNLGSPSFWLLFLGEARKSTPAPQARKPLPIAKRR